MLKILKTNANIFQYAIAAGLLGLTGLGIATLVITSNASKPTETKGIADKTDATGTTALINNDLLFLNAYDYGMRKKATNDELKHYDVVDFSLDQNQNFESLINNNEEHGHNVANEVLLSDAVDTRLSFMRLATDKYVKIATDGDIVAGDKLLAKLILNGKNTPYKQALVGTKGLFNSWFKSEAKNFPSKTWNNEILHGFSEILPKLKQQTKVVYGLSLETVDVEDPDKNNNNHSAMIVHFDSIYHLLHYKRNARFVGPSALEFNIVFNGDQAPKMVSDFPYESLTGTDLNSFNLKLIHEFDDATLISPQNMPPDYYQKTTITTVAIDKSKNDHDNKFAIMNWDKTVDKIYSHSIRFIKITNHDRIIGRNSEVEIDNLIAINVNGATRADYSYNFYFNATKQEVFVSVDVGSDGTSAPEFVKKITVKKIGVIKN